MNRQLLLIFALSGSLCSAGILLAQPNAAVPEPFQGHDPASTYTINYEDLDAMLKASVIDVGRSTRKKAEPVPATTGTRMKSSVKRATVNEGNRFRFEAFAEDDDLRALLGEMRKSLQNIPAQAPLELFSRDEQLAYWLNLYNVTLLDEIVAIYPERSLKKFLTGKKSILAKKILTVAGIELSLDDIQHTILGQNYDRDPLIMYGLYQGVIGGPNIRKRAYTGENVYRNLADNAAEFVNSNRGSEAGRTSVFHVSNLYERNAACFPDFQADLSEHLMAFVTGYEREALKTAGKIKPDISDWSVTDLYGSYRDVGGSFATNKAAMLDAVQASTMVDYQVISTNFSDPSGMVIGKAPGPSRFSPELLAHLTEIKMKEEAAYIEKGGTVTVEELGQAPEPANPELRQEQ
ncbi:MAG: DUF547 domain-containing protein [Xanthomonadales bacterium]|jgi:hypothetical protein|nr:DUF547 domain-containing protein [Xanthomonadales bacterium]